MGWLVTTVHPRMCGESLVAVLARSIPARAGDDVAPQLFHTGSDFCSQLDELGVGRFVSGPNFRSQLDELGRSRLATGLELGP